MDIVQKAPLQAYASALLFSLRESKIRKANSAHDPTKFKDSPLVQDHWGPVLQTLQGHSNGALAAAYSFDGKYLASQSSDYEILLWDARTGALRSTVFKRIVPRFYQTRQSAPFLPKHLTFSHSGLLASVCSAYQVRVWDPVTGVRRGTFQHIRE